MAYAKDLFLESLARCQQDETFLRAFYDRFMDSDPAIRQRFRFTEMDRQTAMLSDSLQVCAAAVESSPEAIRRVNELAQSHDEFHHNALPEWYELWLESLIESAAQSDPAWDANIDEAWRLTLRPIITRMTSRYRASKPT